MQRLAHVDIAETGDDALVAQGGLEARFLVGTAARQHRGVERIAERFRTKCAQQWLVLELGAAHELHVAEPARIVERDGRAGRHRKHHVVVPVVL